MRKEYVERRALLDKYRNVTEYDEGGWSVDYHAVTVDDIKNEPAADVMPIVRSTWERNADGTHYCLNCGHDAPYTYIKRELCSNFCPHCGAVMVGGKYERIY